MSTSIEWTDEVWNCSVGCSRVSAGCEHCYAETVAHRGMSPQHRGLTVLAPHGKGPRWNGVVRFVPEALTKPLTWKKPRRVFVNSMSDLFHEALAFEEIAAIFGVMASAQRHTFQVLTKRPARAAAFFRWVVEQDRHVARASTPGLLHCLAAALAAEVEHHPEGDGGPLHVKHCGEPAGRWPLPNVWIGVSVENQETADARIPWLLELPAAVRFVSYEPAIGPVDFTSIDILGQTREAHPHPHDPIVRVDALRGHVRGPDEKLETRLDWIIVGGESGPRARPFDLAWARSTIAQCAEAGVACFVKQLGAAPIETRPPSGAPDDAGDQRPVGLRDRKGGDPAEWPPGLNIRQFPEATR